ncbi:MAG: NBR1-Ig-like domain-containing protein, partial [Anaerolineales bacterium]
CPTSGLATQLTRADGYYIFDSLHAGTYCVSIDSLAASNAAQLLPGSWTAPRTSSSQSAITITLSEGERRGAIEFGWDYHFLPVPPTPTITPTATFTPTPTLTPTNTPVPIPCDWAAFVKDVTVPDGTVFKPDQDFRKTWQLKNIGTCTWTKDYALVYVSGNRMTGDNVTKLGKSVAPGQTIDISVELTAPVEIGKHTGYWALRNSSGKIFGIGPKAQDPFWVQIEVKKPKTIALNMVTDICQATWSTGAGEITCPTDLYSVDGFIQSLDVPILEGGRVENEPGLWVIPEGVNDGWIKGIYPPFTIKPGDSFRTVVSCWDESPLCNVEFKLQYMNEDGEVKTLGKWVEKYDGSYTKLNIDLSALRGQTVRFILSVSVRDVFDQESSIWLLPSIWR